jgi:hypothetical protein
MFTISKRHPTPDTTLTLTFNGLSPAPYQVIYTADNAQAHQLYTSKGELDAQTFFDHVNACIVLDAVFPIRRPFAH